MSPRSPRRPFAALVAVLSVVVSFIAMNTVPTTGAFSAATSSSGNTFTAASSICSAATVVTSATHDVYVDQNTPTSNTNAMGGMLVTSLASKNRRGLVYLPLPAAPTGCVLSSAFLRLRDYSPNTTRTLQVVQAASAWTETAVTWSTQPATTGSTVDSTVVRQGYVEWLVTPLVTAQYAGTNHGFVIKDSAEGGAVAASNSFYVRESNGSYAPELVLRWAETACPGPGFSGDIVADRDTYVDQALPTTNFGTATSTYMQNSATGARRILLHFPLPTIPAGCTVVANSIQLYSRSASSTTRRYDLSPASGHWTETGVTWATKPLPTTSVAWANSCNGCYSMFNTGADVIIQMYSDDTGFTIVDSIEGGGTSVLNQFDSRENSGGVLPRMNLTYG